MTEFGKNLRWLCGLRRSVSFVARELGINRQQFGRYVNNKSYPNTHNLIALCDYFNVQAADFEMPHSQFSQKYRNVALLKHRLSQRTLEFSLDAFFRQPPRALERFRGDYLIYFNTKTWPNHYMIAFCRVVSRENATFLRYIIRGREPLLGNRILFKGGGQAAKFEHNVFIQSYSKPLAPSWNWYGPERRAQSQRLGSKEFTVHLHCDSRYTRWTRISGPHGLSMRLRYDRKARCGSLRKIGLRGKNLRFTPCDLRGEGLASRNLARDGAAR